MFASGLRVRIVSDGLNEMGLTQSHPTEHEEWVVGPPGILGHGLSGCGSELVGGAGDEVGKGVTIGDPLEGGCFGSGGQRRLVCRGGSVGLWLHHGELELCRWGQQAQLLGEDVQVVIADPVEPKTVGQAEDQSVVILTDDRHRLDPGGVGLLVQSGSQSFSEVRPIHAVFEPRGWSGGGR